MERRDDRRARLIKIIKTEGMLPVRTFASILSVSEMTIRRDLAELSTQHHIESAASKPAANTSYDLLTALKMSYEQKSRIGKKAASLLDPDDFIIIDTGSTTARMLPFLPEDHNLSVLCYNTNVLMELRYKTGINPLFCGGVYHRDTEMFECPESIQFINRIRANKAFLTAAGVHRQLGITCAYGYEVPTKQAIMQSSLEKILLADSGKFDQVRLSYICEISDVNTIITDSGLAESWQDYIRGLGIRLYLV